jgi:FK506-binding protein 9/10
MSSSLFLVGLLVGSVLSQADKFQAEVDKATKKNCANTIKIGDRLKVESQGFLASGAKFENDDVEFVLGSDTAIKPRGSPIVQGWLRGLVGTCPGEKVVMVIPSNLGYTRSQRKPSGVLADSTLYFIVIIKDVVPKPEAPDARLFQSSGLKVDVKEPRECVRADQVKLGDRLVVYTQGFLQDGSVFADATVDFVLGADQGVNVVKGWEQGLVGKCPGEEVEMVIPPELGFGDRAQGNVPGGSTIVSKVRIDAIIRVVRKPRGGDCNEGQKVKPNLDITIGIQAYVLEPRKPSKRGVKFFDKSALETRYGKPNAKTLQRGLETTLTGACTGEERLVLLGPNLAYGAEGNRAYQQNSRAGKKVKPGSVIRVDASIKRVRNKKPKGNLDIQFLQQLADGNARVPSG